MINIEKLRNYSQVRKYETGTVFSRDGMGTEMYIVLQGEVAILNSSDNKVILVVGPGECFNEAILFSNKIHHITTLAITDVIALPINKNNLLAFIANEPNFVIEIMKAIYERFEALYSDFELATGHQWLLRKPEVNVTTSPSPNEHKESETSVPANNNEVLVSTNEPQVDTNNQQLSLFPEGHTGNYALSLTGVDNLNMCELDYTCPICNAKFKGLKILSSRLISSTTDNDMRRHYKNIEPIYYEVITCPHCLYSALSSIFETAECTDPSFVKELKVITGNQTLKFGTNPDTTAIFAGYFLALICAKKCFSKYQLIEARLLQRLSWIYHDCNDEQMARSFAKQSLEKYLQSYSEIHLSADQEIQTCMIIGEFYAMLGNYKEARNFYFKAKSNNLITPVLKRRAENRLDELKELDLAQKN